MTTPRPYHHGSLEIAILEIAIVEIERVGYEALSLRELATAVGVSRAAPYRHFPNRLSFLEAVIARGLKIMNLRLGKAARSHREPIPKVRAVFDQFLQFADDHPQLYRLCFAADMFIQSEPDEAFKKEASRRFTFFARYIALLAPDLSTRDIKLRSVACWSFLHGFAVLTTTQRVHHVLGGPAYDAECRRIVVEQCLQLPMLKIPATPN